MKNSILSKKVSTFLHRSRKITLEGEIRAEDDSVQPFSTVLSPELSK